MKKAFFLMAICLYFQNVFPQFICDGNPLLIERRLNEDNSRIFSIEIDTVPVFTQEVNVGRYVNALAYNPIDNFLYATVPPTGEVFRIDSDGSLTLQGRIPYRGLDGVIAGDINKQGIYVTSGSASSEHFYVIDLNGFSVENIVRKRYNNANNLIPSFSDLAFHPISGICYGYDRINKKMATLNYTTGVVTPYGVTNSLVADVAALFFNNRGELFGYGLLSGDGAQKRLFKIDVNTGQITLLGTGVESSSIDGCSCVSGVSLLKSTDKSSYLPGEEVTFSFTITNTSGNAINDVVFVDSLPSGLTFSSNPSILFGGSITDGTGVGFSNIEITNFTIPARIDTTFTISATLANNSCSNLLNQASLSNLPGPFPPIIYSDDSSTLVVDDPTSIMVENAIPDLFFDVSYNAPVCVGDSLLIETTHFSDVNYTWEGPSGVISSSSTIIVIEDVSQANSGTYYVDYGRNGCTGRDSIDIDITELAMVEINKDTIICFGEEFIVTVQSNAEIFQWQDGSDDESFVVRNEGVYWLEVSNGCSAAIDSLVVATRDCECHYVFPNAFSPNNDQLNDNFEVVYKNVEKFHIKIFDRWGEKVFESDDIDFKWDGRFRGKKLTTDVFGYIAEIKCMDREESFIKKGNITLLH